MSLADALANGTGNDQANLVFHERHTLTTGASKEYDLSGGLVDEFGTTLLFTAIKTVLIKNLNATRRLTIGNGAQPWLTWVGGAVHTVKIEPMGMILLHAPLGGYAVTAGTGDDLLVLNEAGGDTIYDILIVGVSA